MSEPDFDYMSECDKTNSGYFYTEHITKEELLDALQEMKDAAQSFDNIKRLLFRGLTREEMEFSPPSEYEHPLIVDVKYANLFHGIIGIGSEMGEMCDILIDFLEENKEPDETNVKEEVGDNLWYIARILRWAKSDFFTEMKRNIAKLRGRHGVTFDKERDINRDLDAERKILEDEPEDDSYPYRLGYD